MPVWRLLCYGAVSLMYATVKMAHGSNQQRLIRYIRTIRHWSRQAPPFTVSDRLLVAFVALFVNISLI